MSANVRKLVEGSPALSGVVWVTVADAVAYSGISQDQLMREAGDGALNLFCRMARISGSVVPIGALGLHLVVAVPGLGNGMTDPAPKLVDRDSLPSHSYADTCSGVVPIFESSELAQQVLASGLADVAVSILRKDDFSVFVLDVVPMEVTVARLELLAADVESIRQRLARGVSPNAIKRDLPGRSKTLGAGESFALDPQPHHSGAVQALRGARVVPAHGRARKVVKP